MYRYRVLTWDMRKVKGKFVYGHSSPDILIEEGVVDKVDSREILSKIKIEKPVMLSISKN